MDGAGVPAPSTQQTTVRWWPHTHTPCWHREGLTQPPARTVVAAPWLCHRFSPSSDVYMFGITLWEMLVRRMPYSKRAAHEAALLVCTEGLRPSIPRKLRHGAAPYVELMEACWNANPSDRPSMTEVVDKLTEYHPVGGSQGTAGVDCARASDDTAAHRVVRR